MKPTNLLASLELSEQGITKMTWDQNRLFTIFVNGSSGSGKTKSLNLLSNYDDINKIYFYTRRFIDKKNWSSYKSKGNSLTEFFHNMSTKTNILMIYNAKM